MCALWCRYLRAWDPRTRGNPAKVQLHVNEQGHGAVSEIAAGEVVIMRRVGYGAVVTSPCPAALLTSNKTQCLGMPI